MMKTNFIPITFLQILICLNLSGQKYDVKIYPTMPQPKDSVSIELSAPNLTNTNNKMFLQFSSSNFYEMPQSLEMNRSGDKWWVKFQLPFYANYSSFYITDENKELIIRPTDTTHYEIFVYENGKLKEGNYLAKGYSTAIQNRNSQQLWEQQMKNFLIEKRNYPNNYENNLKILQFQMQKASNPKEHENLRKQALQVIERKFRSAPTSDGNLNKVTMGFLILGEKSKVDSIRNVVINEFPSSKLGISYKLNKVLHNTDTVETLDNINQLLRLKNNDNQHAFQEAYVYLFKYHLNKGEVEQAKKYFPLILEEQENPYIWRTYLEYVDLLLEKNTLLDKAEFLNNLVLENILEYPVSLVRFFPETGHLRSFVADRDQKISEINAEVLLRKGVIEIKKGNLDKGKDLIERNIKLTQSKEILLYVAKLSRDIGLKEQESHSLHHAYLLFPYDQEIKSLLIDSLLKVNNDQSSIQNYFSNLDKQWKSEYFISLDKKITKGKSFPKELSIQDMKGNNITASDLKGKVVVVDLWATWCLPCLASFPYVNQVYLKYKDNPEVMFLMLNTGSGNSFDDARNWFEKNKHYSFPVYYNNDKKLNNKLEVNSIPTTFLLDPSGNIVFKKIGSEGEKILQDLDAMIEYVLQNRHLNLK
ncbi:TlpA disulfide reductase family protein [Sphingobacterium humi]|uniref:Redoxin domain-containing protein n=1 Tax=Sphingobacterium humi TaxID=1796905 RepID=A0A6N8L5Z3_9SPHI|nr:TlpA disulfide reductase family protein [Sphingobacterium humi]MVZ63871.1 redoxin domain-containing protein [Sphingobacterium humi]